MIAVLGLMGFSGHDRFVELESFVNGRTSADFRSSANNVRTVLQTGTRGQILNSQKLPSGNYALKVRTLNGTHKGQEFWVYLNQQRPALKTFETPPKEWGLSAKTGRVAETKRDVPAIRAPVPAADTAVSVFRKADRLNTQLRQTTGPVAGCSNCAGVDGTPRRSEPLKIPPANAPLPLPRYQQSAADFSGGTTPIYRRGKLMNPSCSNFVGNNGALGPWGQQVASIMNEPQYRQSFLKPQALGNFCPRFESLSTEMKLKAWTWFWQSLAQEESSCDVNKPHPTTYVDRRGQVRVLNPREGWGLWALEKDRNIRAGRGSACNSIRDVAGQARCAIDIMHRQQLTRGGNAEQGGRKYWGPTIGARASRQIIPHMRRFAACF